MTETPDVPGAKVDLTGSTDNPKKKLFITIPLALVAIALGAAVYFPGMMVGGMATDSCSSGANAYVMWEVWLLYLWPVIMFVCALLPTVLVLRNIAWKWAVVSMAGGLAVSVLWYILWFPLLMIFGGC